MTDLDKSLDADLDLDAADTDGVTGGMAQPAGGPVSWGPPSPLVKDPLTGERLRPSGGAPSVTAAPGHNRMVSAGGAAEVKGPPTPAWAKTGATAPASDAVCGGWPDSYKGPVPTVCDEGGGGERSMTYDEYLKSGGNPVV